jgi:hypothetical protein
MVNSKADITIAEDLLVNIFELAWLDFEQGVTQAERARFTC